MQMEINSPALKEKQALGEGSVEEEEDYNDELNDRIEETQDNF